MDAAKKPAVSIYTVGQRVRAKVLMENDLTDVGYGVEICAERGDELIVRAIRASGNLAVSHEHITDRAFMVSADEIEPI